MTLISPEKKSCLDGNEDSVSPMSVMAGFWSGVFTASLMIVLAILIGMTEPTLFEFGSWIVVVATLLMAAECAKSEY